MTATRRPAFELPRLQLLPPSTVAAPRPRVVVAPAPLPAAPTLSPGAPTPAIVAARPVPPTVRAPVVVVPVVPNRAIHRRDGALGLTIGIVILTLVLAAALTAQRTMHGWPPGMH